MYLHTDDQTREDLRIFGRNETGGIFDIYNHCYTRGGETLLEDFFHRPLADKAEINRRSELIAGFAQRQLRFPFASATFDMAEKYLNHAGTQAANPAQQAAIGEKEIYNGVTAIITLLQQLHQFIVTGEVNGLAAYAQEREHMQALLNDAAFIPALHEKLKGKLSFSTVTAYDLLFRAREADKIAKLMQHIYYLDVYLSVAEVAVRHNFVFPKALDKGTGILKLTGVYHPALRNPVGNDINLDDEAHLIFLTGANMAGKSTFLRSLGTAVYIAHAGLPVAAGMMEFSVLDGIYTTINLPDNLGIGASHFYAEVLRVKKIAKELHSGKSVLVIFDELFRGTNVKDAQEATVAVAEAFAKRKNSFFIISSHIVEAGEALRERPGIGFYYLPTIMEDHTPRYTYTLKQGISDDRHGMIIIRNEGILDILKQGRKNSNGAVLSTENNAT